MGERCLSSSARTRRRSPKEVSPTRMQQFEAALGHKMQINQLQTALQQQHSGRHKGEEQHVPQARCRLGLAGVSDIVAQNRPGTSHRCSEASIENALEESPIGAHAGNGHVEGAIWRMAARRCSRVQVPAFAANFLRCEKPLFDHDFFLTENITMKYPKRQNKSTTVQSVAQLCHEKWRHNKQCFKIFQKLTGPHHLGRCESDARVVTGGFCDQHAEHFQCGCACKHVVTFILIDFHTDKSLLSTSNVLGSFKQLSRIVVIPATVLIDCFRS